jgi:hypothetical protein
VVDARGWWWVVVVPARLWVAVGVVARGYRLGHLSLPPFVCRRWPSFVSGRGGRLRFGVRSLSLMGGRARFVLFLSFLAGWGFVWWAGLCDVA